MSMLGATLSVIAIWAWGWPKAVGNWRAEVVKAYRAALEQEGSP